MGTVMSSEKQKPIYDLSQESRKQDLMEFASLGATAHELHQIYKEITKDKAIYRPTAVTIESIAEGTLGERYPVSSFTLHRSATNLKVTQEAIMEKVREVIQRIIEMMVKLYQKVVEVIENLYNRITDREAKFEAASKENDTYRKANSMMLSTIPAADKQDIAVEAGKVDGSIGDGIKENYHGLFDAFIKRDKTYQAYQQLSSLYKPYLDYVLDRMRKYIDLSYQIARLSNESALSTIGNNIAKMADQSFDRGDRFVTIVTGIPLSREYANDTTFAAYLSGYRQHLNELKRTKLDKAPSFKEFTAARLWELSFEGSKEIPGLLAEVKRLSDRMEALKPFADEVDKDVVKNYTQLGTVIRREAHSIMDITNIASEIIGLRLIAIRVEASKAREMYSIIRTKASEEAQAQAKAAVDELNK